MALAQPINADEALMRELRLALTTSHAMNNQRTPYTGPVRKWSGRIEKSRSTHTSPAHDSRRRAWSGTTQIQPLYSNIYALNPQTIHPRVSAHQRNQRPLSWHPTSGQIPTYTSSPMTVDIQHPIPPAYPEFSPQVLSTSQPAYDLPELYMQTGPLSTSSTSTAGIPDTSPVWQVNTNQTYILADHQQSCQLQQDTNIWSHPLSATGLQNQSESINPHYQNMLANIHAPGTEIAVENEEEEEEDGEILIGVGLYDDPLEPGKNAPNLKLAETWNPPPSSDGTSDESDNEDTSCNTPVESSQLQDQAPQILQAPVDAKETTSSYRDCQISIKDEWQSRVNQSPIHGLNFGTGWMHASSWQTYVDRRTMISQ